MSRGMSGPGASFRAGVAYGAIFGPYGSDPYAGMYGTQTTSGGSRARGGEGPLGPVVEQPATTGTSTKAQDVARKVQNRCDEALTAAAAGKPAVARFKITAARNLASKAPTANGVRDWLLEQVAACSAQVESTLAAQAPAMQGPPIQSDGGVSVQFGDDAPGYTEPNESTLALEGGSRFPSWIVIAGIGVLLTGAGLWAAAGKGVSSRAAPIGNPRRRRSRKGYRR